MAIPIPIPIRCFELFSEKELDDFQDVIKAELFKDYNNQSLKRFIASHKEQIRQRRAILLPNLEAHPDEVLRYIRHFVSSRDMIEEGCYAQTSGLSPRPTGHFFLVFSTKQVAEGFIVKHAKSPLQVVLL